MLDHQDQIRLQGLIFRARLRDFRIDDNFERLMKRAAALGLHPKPAPVPATFDHNLCVPILGPGTQPAT